MQQTTEYQPGLTIRTLRLEVPVDHGLARPPAIGPDTPADVALPADTLELFARVVTGTDGADKPYLVFLQGGPGGEAPRPSLTTSTPSWLRRALQDYQVVMLDPVSYTHLTLPTNREV